jgi:hypothetical protein
MGRGFYGEAGVGEGVGFARASIDGWQGRRVRAGLLVRGGR